MILKKTTYILLFSLIFQLANAQVDTSFIRSNISYGEYIKRVSDNNLGYAAEKFNINIADAEIEKSRVFQDPSLSFDVTNQTEDGSNAGYTVSSEISKTFEIFGKRKARINLAKSERELTQAMVEDYFRNLRADATVVYLEALMQNQLFKVKIDSYNTIKQLSVADSIRFSLGNIMEIDAAQSKVEAEILFNELLKSEAEWKNSLNQLPLMMGISNADSILLPNGSLTGILRSFNLNELTETAINNRTDLLVALKGKDVLQRNLTLTKRERRMDVDLKIGLENSYNSSWGNTNAKAITAGLAIPLKFSNLNRGEVKMAQYQVSQAEKVYEQTEAQVKSEVVQAYNLYNAYCKQVESFDKGLLENANNVKKGKIYSYERGETSLLEVLNAQRTYNDIQTAYYEALYNRAAALVDLEKAVGIWDISF
jgi:cobalt-zinc-cadmium efflux system outer membrane protein